MKKLICALLAGLMLLTLIGCDKKDNAAEPSDTVSAADTPSASDTQTAADDDLSYILGKKKLIVGITENRPMNYHDDANVLVGFDTEFTEALCAKLGVTAEFKTIEWSSKEIELNAKNIDCIWNGFTVTAERRENIGFTVSYLHNEQVVVVRAADAAAYTTAESLAGKKVVAEDGSAGMDAAAEFLPDSSFTAVVSQATALLEVKAGTADAAVLDLTMARALTQESTDFSDLMIVTSIEMWPEEYAIGLRLGSSAVAKFDEIIKELIADGTLPAIAEKYGLASELIAK